MKRSWMALVAATASLAVAAGCGGGGGSDNAGSGGGVKPVAKIGPTEGALNLIAWQGYTEPNVVKPFEAADRLPGARHLRADLRRHGAAHAHRQLRRRLGVG